MAGYVPLHRRRREGVTDYRSRRRAISSRRALLVVRISNKNVSAQFVRPAAKGDLVLASAHSAQLRKMGWQGSLTATPACYLLGLAAGKKALEKGVKDAILYCGLAPFVSGSRVSAFVKGVRDSGLEVPVDEEVLPDEERITGKTIAEHASKLAADDREAYAKRFSAMIERGFKPEGYQEKFEQLRTSIAGGKK